jgi:hypothetical protein
VIRWLAVLLLLLSPAWAQPKPVQFTLTQDEAQLVLNKLSEHPWKDVNPVMSKIITQLNAQMAPPPKEAKPNE